MSEPIFKLKHLEGYHIINKPCTAIIKASADAHLLIHGSNPRYLIGLRVVREDDIPIFESRVGDKIVNFNYISDLLITGAIFKDKIENEIELPTKGEDIIGSFDYINGKLMCVHLSVMPRTCLEKVSLERLTRTQQLFAEVMKSKNVLKND